MGVATLTIDIALVCFRQLDIQQELDARMMRHKYKVYMRWIVIVVGHSSVHLPGEIWAKKWIGPPHLGLLPCTTLTSPCSLHLQVLPLERVKAEQYNDDGRNSLDNALGKDTKLIESSFRI